MFADPTDAATAAVVGNGNAFAMSARAATPALAVAVPTTVYRKHGLLGLGQKTLIVVHPPIHATFTVQ
jgi:hypothetical protein